LAVSMASSIPLGERDRSAIPRIRSTLLSSIYG
jgi:hypothetical protein